MYKNYKICRYNDLNEKVFYVSNDYAAAVELAKRISVEFGYAVIIHREGVDVDHLRAMKSETYVSGRFAGAVGRI